MTTATVVLWGREIGAVTWEPNQEIGIFQYTPEFAASSIEVAPLMMPLREAPYQFPSLGRESFRGLPGMLADSLPDRFGNALINAWLAKSNRSEESFTPVERLCYTGTRGMGALEFRPVLRGAPTHARRVEIDRLVELANEALDVRTDLVGRLTGWDDKRAIEDILRVGTSAGGARAKAILAWNAQTGEFRSGQAPAAKGFTHWLLKFDGITHNRDKELADPQGYGRIEYAYSRMAKDAGIVMTECRLHEEGGRAHFMTRRFDRTASGGKLHMQSLSAMRHFDFNRPDLYSYEEALRTIRKLGLPREDLEQQVRRAMFNVIGRNHDDHTKNIAFLMDKAGTWRLSPAFDVTYSYNPTGAWTSRHQMSVNGKRDDFVQDDLLELASVAGLKTQEARRMIGDVSGAVARWPDYAKDAGVPQSQTDGVARALRLELAG